MSLGPDELRDRVAASITTGLHVLGWNESQYAFDSFPGGDDQLVAHLDFAVGLGGTRGMQGRQPRTGAGRGALVTTDVRVRFLSQIRADGEVADLGDALRNEVKLVDAVLAVDGDPDLGVRFVEVVQRGRAFAGLFIGELKFEAVHLYPLGTASGT